MRYTLVATAVLVAAAVNAGAATLAIAGRANSTPSLAAANRFVAVAWGAMRADGTSDVYAAISHDGARTFAAPTRVNDVVGQASLGAEQPPRVALVPRAGRDPEVLIVWTAKSQSGTRLLYSRSGDGGVSFTHATSMPGTDAAGNRGWESTAVDHGGHPIAVWLDHREMAHSGGASHTQHEGHDHAGADAQKMDGAARAQGSRLYFGSVDNVPGAHALAAGVCYCCKTALASGPDGAIFAAWRHVYAGNIRDIAFTMSRDGGRTFTAPARVSDDGWILDGCPENGPSLAVGADNVVHVVWPTLVAGATADAEPALALFHATTRDGLRFSPRERIATEGTPRHPQLTATSAGLVAAWDEQTASGLPRVVLARLRRGSGPAGVSREIVSGSARAQTPAIAASSEGVVIAWAEGTEPSVIRVERR